MENQTIWASYDDEGQIDRVFVRKDYNYFTSKDGIKRAIEGAISEIRWAENHVYADERVTAAWNDYMKKICHEQQEYIDDLLEALGYLIRPNADVATTPAEIRKKILTATKNKPIHTISVREQGEIIVFYSDGESEMIGCLESKNLIDIIEDA